MSDDERYMREALAEARRAFERGEVPVGAVVVRGTEVIARASNRREEWGDPTAHAEVVALREAGRRLGGWRIDEATLYVTVEPCPMCAGALIQARVPRLVFGARDPKAGAVGSVVNILAVTGFNHRVEVTGGVLEDECAGLMRRFFRERR